MYSGSMGIPEYDAWLLVRQTHDLCDRLQRRQCQLAGISVSALEVLYLIKSEPKPITAYKLANLLGREHHSVVEIVNRLKAKGLLERRTISGKSSLDITETGDQALIRALEKPTVGTVFASLGEDGLQRLTEELVPLRQAAMKELGLIELGEVQLQPLAEMMTPESERKTRNPESD